MRLKSLDGLRGLAALFIAFYHVQIVHSLYDLHWFRDIQGILDLFFVISGFVIARIYSQRLNTARDATEFMIRRTGRIWPVHAVTLGLLIAAEITRAVIMSGGHFDGAPAPFSGERTPETIIPNLVLAQSWGWERPLEKAMSWNYPSWTVSTEYLAYGCMAVLCLTIRSRASRIAAAIAIMLCAGVVYYVSTDGWSDIRGISIARCIMGFFAGYLVNELTESVTMPTPPRWVRSCTELIVLGAAVFMLGANGFPYMAMIGLIAAVVFIFAADGGLISEMLSVSPLLWLGERSFSIYMVHVPVMAALDFAARAVRKVTGLGVMSGEYIAVPGAPWATDALALVYMIIVIGAAALLYRYVEAPSRDFGNALAKAYRTAHSSR